MNNNNDKEQYKQVAFESISTMIELKKADVPTIYGMYMKKESRQKVLELVLDLYLKDGASSYEHAITAVDKSFDINSYED